MQMGIIFNETVMQRELNTMTTLQKNDILLDRFE